MTNELMIFGTGAHARKAFYCATQAGLIVSAFVDEKTTARSPVLGVPVFRTDKLDECKRPKNLFVAIGRADVRRRLMDRYGTMGWQFPALIHPRASVSPGVTLGEGVLVAAGAVVESGSELGRGAIIDVGVIIDHDCRIGEFCHLRAGSICQPGSEWTS